MATEERNHNSKHGNYRIAQDTIAALSRSLPPPWPGSPVLALCLAHGGCGACSKCRPPCSLVVRGLCPKAPPPHPLVMVGSLNKQPRGRAGEENKKLVFSCTQQASLWLRPGSCVQLSQTFSLPRKHFTNDTLGSRNSSESPATQQA